MRAVLAQPVALYWSYVVSDDEPPTVVFAGGFAPVTHSTFTRLSPVHVFGVYA
jgi:hypothetical protein